MTRLAICPNKDCTIILQMGGDDEHVDAGGSVFCCGKLPETDIQIFNEITHVNDYGFCVYTPKKGMVNFLINANDSFIMEKLMGAILKDYRKGLKIS